MPITILRAQSSRVMACAVALVLAASWGGPVLAQQAQAAESQQQTQLAAAQPTQANDPTQQTQAADLPQETQSESQSTLQEVVVTAQLRRQNEQVVPVSVSAFSASTLQQFQANNIDALTLSTPGFTISRTQGSMNGASIYIRGIGNDSSSVVNEPGVGLYVDDVYLGQDIGTMVDFIDVDSVEILRGPQGTLYGRNTIGGAIKVETQEPTIGQLSASGDVTVGSFDETNVRGVVNLPLNDQMAMSVSGISLTNDGWYKNAVTGVNLNRQDTRGLKLAYLWNIASNVNLFVTADYDRDRSGFYVATPMTTQNPATTQPVYGSYFLSDPTLPDNNRFDGGGLMARLTWNTDIGTVESISSFRTFSFYQDFDLSYVPGGLKLARPFGDHQATEEIRFTSNWSGPFSLVGGLYYYRDHADELPYLTVAPGLTFLYGNDQVSKSVAAYTQLTYALTKKLSVTLGGRETKDNKNIAHTGLFAGVTGNTGYTEFTPMGTVGYKATRDAYLYVTGSGGYTAGQFQGFPSSDATAAAATPPEFVTAMEAGAKTEFLDHRLKLNLAAFHNDYTNLPVTVNSSASLIQVVSTDLKAYGAELNLEYRPIEALTLSGYISRLKTEFITALPGVADAPQYGNIQRYSPPWSARLSGDYEIPLNADYDLGFDANVIWSDTDQTTGVPNEPFFVLPPLTLINAGLTFTNTKDDWSVTLGGKNLTNALWWDQASVSSGAIRYYQPPRTWSITFAYNR